MLYSKAYITLPYLRITTQKMWQRKKTKMDNEQKEQIRVALKNAELWMKQVRREANMESALTMSEVKAARKLLEEE